MADVFAGFDEDSSDLQVRKCVVFGPVGSGKTGLCKYVAGLLDIKNVEDCKLSGTSVTSKIKPYVGRYIRTRNVNQTPDLTDTKVQYTMIDSEGYGADAFSSDSLKNQLTTALKFETALNCMILCVSMERFRNGLKDDLTHLLGIIKTLGLEKESMIVVFTHCEIYKNEQRETFVDQFKKYYDFDFGKNYLFACFANIGEVNENYMPMISEDVKNSIHLVRSKINNMSAIINVASKIYDIEHSIYP